VQGGRSEKFLLPGADTGDPKAKDAGKAKEDKK
jgi:hypothetical protein